jgi:hypothetical protein
MLSPRLKTPLQATTPEGIATVVPREFEGFSAE